MNLQQLRYLLEVSKQKLNISDAANALFTSQPGVSKQIKLLEEELGIEIFIRKGKRITGITKPGKEILSIAERILNDTENLRQVGKEFAGKDNGSLTIATTHTQARYALPQVIKKFVASYPNVKLALHQGSPTQIAEQVISGEADIAIATESVSQHDELATLDCYEWNHCLVTQPNHPLLKEKKVSLAKIAEYPIITYDFAFTGRGKINTAFQAANINPNVVLTAIDADVIKTYVDLGLGVGILAQMAFNPRRDRNLRALDLSHLFQPSITRVAFRKNEYLRGYVYDFFEMFAPHLTREQIFKETLNKSLSESS